MFKYQVSRDIDTICMVRGLYTSSHRGKNLFQNHANREKCKETIKTPAWHRRRANKLSAVAARRLLKVGGGPLICRRRRGRRRAPPFAGPS